MTPQKERIRKTSKKGWQLSLRRKDKEIPTSSYVKGYSLNQEKAIVIEVQLEW